jgi:hypothetical protein
MAGSIGLTDKQVETYNALSIRKGGEGKPLTANMEVELADLQQKKDNPELPAGAKTYCKKWLKERLYQRWRELSNKYIEKGNLCEEDGFTLMAVQLNLGMVFKNTQRKNNGSIMGEWDLFVDNVVYDNKASWDLETFPMFETKPDPDYVWQLQGYMELTGADKSVLAHTLNDAPEKMLYDAVKWYDDHATRAKIIKNMVYTQKGWEIAAKLFFDGLPENLHPKFIPIPDKERIKTFTVFRDNIAIGNIYHRKTMCNSYINSLITNNQNQ